MCAWSHAGDSTVYICCNESVLMTFIVNCKKLQGIYSFCVLQKSFPVRRFVYIARGGFMQVINYKGLTCCSERESCNEIHTQLQTNGRVPTLFAFCINPSLEIVYQSYYEGFMQIRTCIIPPHGWLVACFA